MQIHWVGDKRDYVKWSGIREYAAADGFVFYIPMLRNLGWGSMAHPEVKRFFDTSKDLSNFHALFPNRFHIFDQDYENLDASRYFDIAVQEIRKHKIKSNGRLIIFVDPDTGIAPKSRAGKEHVNIKHLQDLSSVLEDRDRLIVYQHASRSKTWLQDSIERLKMELQSDCEIDKYFQEDISPDIALIIVSNKSS